MHVLQSELKRLHSQVATSNKKYKLASCQPKLINVILVNQVEVNVIQKQPCPTILNIYVEKEREREEALSNQLLRRNHAINQVNKQTCN